MPGPLDPVYACGLAPALIGAHETLHYAVARALGDKPKVFRRGINVGVRTWLSGWRLALAALAPQVLTIALAIGAVATPMKWLAILAIANIVASVSDFRLAIKECLKR